MLVYLHRIIPFTVSILNALIMIAMDRWVLWFTKVFMLFLLICQDVKMQHGFRKVEIPGCNRKLLPHRPTILVQWASSMPAHILHHSCQSKVIPVGYRMV